MIDRNKRIKAELERIYGKPNVMSIGECLMNAPMGSTEKLEAELNKLKSKTDKK